MEEISLLEMLKNGVHFGHQKSRWHPKMKPYVYTVRGGVHIINLEKTQEELKKAEKFISNIVSKQGTVLFVGTKRQAKEIVKKHAENCGMPHVTERWLGGLFTNFANVSKLPEKLKRLQSDKEKGEFEKYTKRERLRLEEEIERLKLIIGGIKDLNKLPEAVFIVDIKKESTCLNEAIKVGIPIVAIIDTNANPTLVDYPIPGNDDAAKSIDLIMGAIVQAVLGGKSLLANIDEKQDKKGAPKEEQRFDLEEAKI